MKVTSRPSAGSSGGGRSLVQVALERLPAPRGHPLLQIVGGAEGAEGGAVAAAVLLQLAQRVPHRHPVAVGNAGAAQLRLQGLRIVLAQRTRLDVRQATPCVATRRIQGQRGAVARCRIIEATGMQQCIAQQHMRWQQVGHQRGRMSQGLDRLVGAAPLLQVAAQVEPGHRLRGIQRAGAAPAGEGGIEVARRRLRRAQVAMQQRVAGRERQRALQRLRGKRRAPGVQLHDGQVAQRLRMRGRAHAGIEQQAFRQCRVAVAQRACAGLHLRGDLRRQACHARVAAHPRGPSRFARRARMPGMQEAYTTTSASTISTQAIARRAGSDQASITP